MSPTRHLLTELRAHGVRVRVEGDTLRLSAPGKAGSAGQGWPATLAARWRVEPPGASATFCVGFFFEAGD